jgi:hypothetical protein
MSLSRYKIIFVCCLSMLFLTGITAQEVTAPKESKPVKDMFSSIWIIDNQTVMVPYKGTLEFDIQHRFGPVYNGFEDLWGLYAPSNIRLGFTYVPMDKLMVGFGLTKSYLTWDVNAKYAILKQMSSGGSPVSLTYYGNAAIDTRDKSYFANADDLAFTDRLSFFHQLLVARKISDKFSLQLAGSLSHFNTVYPNENPEDGSIQELKNDNFSLALSARYKLSNALNILFNYDQPLTTRPSADPQKPDTKDPKPNLSLGLEITSSAHQFQIFLTNYSSLVPQRNNAYNTNWGFGDKKFSLWDPEWVIGFNITRLWSY